MKRNTCLNCSNFSEGHCWSENSRALKLDGPFVVQHIDNCKEYTAAPGLPGKGQAESSKLKRVKAAAQSQYRSVAKRGDKFFIYNDINVGELGKEGSVHFKSVDEVMAFLGIE